MTNFIQRNNSLILWQTGHYAYEITRGVQPYRTVQKLTNTSFEQAKKIFEKIA